MSRLKQTPHIRAKECDYKKQWVDAGKFFRIPSAVAFGKEYMPLVSKWMQTKYCNRKG